MVGLKELKRISLLQEFPDELLQKLQPLGQLRLFSEKSTIFDQGQRAEFFYMLLRGKVLLEVELTKDIMISIESIKPGYSFGWSSLFRGDSYRASAICSEPCEVIAFQSEQLLNLLDEDPHLGYWVMKEAMGILKNQLIRRTEQFLNTLRMHPEIQKLFPEQ